MNNSDLQVRVTPGAAVEKTDAPGWLFKIPAGDLKGYRWAQLDDYLHRNRSDFPWKVPFSLSLKARVSMENVQGTWGFGLWNDPFNMSLGLRGTVRRLPALPNTAWFFYASKPNYLAFRDSHPAQGMLAATFSAPRVPTALLGFLAPFLPLMAWKYSARWLRKAARIVIKEDACALPIDVTAWHDYHLDCQSDLVRFEVDQIQVCQTTVVPRGYLGLVIWIDNQFAAFPQDGKLSFGTLAADLPSWLEIADLRIEQI